MKRNFKIAAIVIGISFFMLMAAKKPTALAQTNSPQTAGQKFKNIKVLNDMPADQLGKVMNIFSASLAVDCNFCHVEGDFSKDDKKEKSTAREMIKMTLALDKEYFRGRPEVSCNTCHSGHEHPQSIPNLDAVAAHDQRPPQPDVKPTTDQIVDKYLAALGGTAQLAKITSRYIKAKRIERDGTTVEPEEVWLHANKYLAATTYDKFVVREKFDGTKAEKFSNSEAITLRSDDAEQIKREAELFSPANIKTIYPKMEFRTVDKINGRDVYLVSATTADGLRERLAFDVQTGLLVRRSASTPTIFGNFVYQVDYSDYKDFGGVKMPAKIRYAMPNRSWTRQVITVRTNTSLSDTVFNSPVGKK